MPEAEPEERLTVSGIKTWADNRNAAKKRPESITIRLHADGKEIAYTITEDAVENYSAVVKGYDVTNTLVTDQETFIITYDLNGGIYNGQAGNIVESYPYGTVISIHAAPVRAGYVFSYWKGSSYYPGDQYTVTGDHTFVAQWTPAASPSSVTPANPANPATGDSSRSGFWLAMLIAGFTGLCTAGYSLRRRRRSSGSGRRTGMRLF